MAATDIKKYITEAELFLKQCEEGGQSDYALVMQLQNIIDLTIDIGVKSDRVCMKVEGGVVEVVERLPAVAVSASAQIHRMKQDARKVIEKADAPDPVINLIVQETRLEDIL